MEGCEVQENPEAEEEIKELFHPLAGRVGAEMWVVDGRTGERSLMLSFDFDLRDTVDVVFSNSECRVPDGSIPVEESSWSFNFMDKPGEEVEDEMSSSSRRNTKGPSEDDLKDALAHTFIPKDPTAEDFYTVDSVSFSDLPVSEK